MYLTCNFYEMLQMQKLLTIEFGSTNEIISQIFSGTFCTYFSIQNYAKMHTVDEK